MSSVAFLSFYSGEVERGVETFVYEIAKRISKKHKVSIFQGGSVIRNPEIKTYTIKSFSKTPKINKGKLSKFYLDTNSLKILFFTLQTIPRILKNSYDVMIPLNGGWQALIIRIISKFTGSKVLISGHAGMGSDDAWNIFTRPDVFVALTSSEKKWANNLSGEIQVELIPNGVDLSTFNPQIKAKKLELPKPIVICTSALDSYKRIDFTIRAVARTKSLSLLLLGQGSLAGQIDSLGKRLLKNRYLRLNVPYKEISSYYRTGKVFTLASATEAFGISYVEAMACNLPVVTTNDQSRAEIIADAGILTETGNIDAYARDLLIAARTNYRNIPYNQALKFSWNKIALLYSNLIKNLATK